MIRWAFDEHGRRVSNRSRRTRPQRDYVAPDGTLYTPQSLIPYTGHDFDRQRWVKAWPNPATMAYLANAHHGLTDQIAAD